MAELAEVSTATVSYTFNMPEKVRPETRERVLAASEELGFRPNVLARALRKGKHAMVGIIVSDIQTPYVASIVRSAQEALERADQIGVVVSTDGQSDTIRGAIENLVDRGVAAFVICPIPFRCDEETIDYFLELGRRGILISLISNSMDEFPGDVVNTKSRLAAAAMVEYLVSLGHRRIAWIGRPTGPELVGMNRQNGFIDGLKAAGLELIVDAALDMDSGLRAADQLLSLDNPPSAVLAIADVVAAGFLMGCYRAGLTVPQDISVAGLNDDPIARQVWPRLTTMRPARQESGSTAVKLLVERQQDESLPPRKPALDFELVIRESTGPPAAD